MKSRYPLHGGLLAGLFLAGCASTGHRAGEPDSLYKDEVSAGLEEIYVTRTTRTQFIQGPTPACAAAPFTSQSEQHYDTWSVAVRASDARIVKTHEKRVGEFTACFGPVMPNGTFAMYSRGTTGSLAHAAIGECRFMQTKPPAPKLLVLNCSGTFTEVPGDYIGGYITSSSLAPTGGKDATHVRGYLSTSVITTRLWKKPR